MSADLRQALVFIAGLACALISFYLALVSDGPWFLLPHLGAMKCMHDLAVYTAPHDPPR